MAKTTIASTTARLTHLQKNGAGEKLVLALRPRDAAKALNIGERLLWSKTNSGEIPHVRIGRSVLYPIDLLREWLAQQAKKGSQR